MDVERRICDTDAACGNAVCPWLGWLFFGLARGLRQHRPWLSVALQNLYPQSQRDQGQKTSVNSIVVHISPLGDLADSKREQFTLM